MLYPQALVHCKQDIVVFFLFFFLNSTKEKNSRGCHCKHINMYHKNENNHD